MAMGRALAPLTLQDEERETLARWVRRPNIEVAAELGFSNETVGKWRTRFVAR